jgi:hypothetical protein
LSAGCQVVDPCVDIRKDIDSGIRITWPLPLFVVGGIRNDLRLQHRIHVSAVLLSLFLGFQDFQDISLL